MNQVNLEGEIIRMGDVGVVIDMVDDNLTEGRRDQAERAVLILKEVFGARYESLRKCMNGGECNAR